MQFIPNEIETSSDRLNEVNILQYLSSKYNIDYKQSDQYCRYDATLAKNEKSVAIVEIKCRSNNHNTFPTYFISYDKWKICKQIAQKNKVKFLILVRFKNGLFFLDETNTTLSNERFVTRVKTNTRGSLEQDEVINIPVKYLRPF
jgi:hypothetical protein